MPNLCIILGQKGSLVDPIHHLVEDLLAVLLTLDLLRVLVVLKVQVFLHRPHSLGHPILIGVDARLACLRSFLACGQLLNRWEVVCCGSLRNYWLLLPPLIGYMSWLLYDVLCC